MDSGRESSLKTTLIPLTFHNKNVLKVLVDRCFPITYTDKFYEKVAILYKEFVQYVAIKDVVVGAVLCRIEEDEKTKESFIHLMIILVLERYRRLGIAHKLMDFIYKQAKENHKDIQTIRLHVQKTNQGAINFYKKHGFEIVNEIEKYYDLEDSAALEMRKNLYN